MGIVPASKICPPSPQILTYTYHHAQLDSTFMGYHEKYQQIAELNE
jgi:hypothetical protein